jgi:hypothetical protein
VLWLTPVLNAERLSANSQIARLATGALAAKDITMWEYQDWGLAGARLIAAINEKAALPGHEDFAAAAANTDRYGTTNLAARAQSIAALQAEMPLQPVGATARRDQFLNAMSEYDLAEALASCRITMPNGAKGCVMVLADLLPAFSGDEAIIVRYQEGGYGGYQAYRLEGEELRLQQVWGDQRALYSSAGPEKLILDLQSTPPEVTPAPVNQIRAGGLGLTISWQ